MACHEQSADMTVELDSFDYSHSFVLMGQRSSRRRSTATNGASTPTKADTSAGRFSAFGGISSADILNASNLSTISRLISWDNSECMKNNLCSTMLYEDIPSEVLENCLNIWDVPRPSPDGTRPSSAMYTDSLRELSAIEMVRSDRDPSYAVPTNTPESSVSEADTLSLATPKAQESTPKSRRESRRSVNNKTRVISRRHRKQKESETDMTLASDVSEFMRKPLCRRGVVVEAKMSRARRRSLAQKLKNIGKKIHGFSNVESLQTLAVL